MSDGAPNKVLDTNIVLYLLAGRLVDPARVRDACISIVTDIELLSFRLDDEVAERSLRAFLDEIEIIPLTHSIKLHAISLRQNARLKLPDAVIAGTAMALGVELLSNDEALATIPGLHCAKMAIIDAH